MAHVKEIQLHRRAEMALDAYPAAERKKVERAILRLAEPDEAPGRPEVRRLSISDPDFIMWATPTVRVLFNETPEAIQVLDVVLADKLKGPDAAPEGPMRPAPPDRRASPPRRKRGEGVAKPKGPGGR